MRFAYQKFIVALIVFTIAAIAFTACGSDDGGPVSSSGLSERTLVLNDGREITCIKYSAGYAGGLSCDW